MSGGSYNYACQKVDDIRDLWDAFGDVKDIEARLRELQMHDAADEVLKFILAAETARRRLEVMGRRLAPLLKAVEWADSGDWGEDAIPKTWKHLLGEEEAP